MNNITMYIKYEKRALNVTNNYTKAIVGNKKEFNIYYVVH